MRARIGRYVSLVVIALGLTTFTLHTSAWKSEHSWTIIVLPLSFLVNAVSIEILYIRMKRHNAELQRIIDESRKGDNGNRNRETD